MNGTAFRSLAIVFSLLTLSGRAWATTEPLARREHLPVEVILQRWSAQMHVDRPRQVHFERTVYDKVFHRVERGSGSLALDRAGHGRFLLAPAAISESPKRYSDAGVQYEIVPSSTTRWYWADTTIFQVRPEDNSYWQCERGQLGWLTAALESPQSLCPLVLGFRAADLTEPLNWEINRDWKRRTTEIYLTANPRSGGVRFGPLPWYANFSRIDVLIDRQSYETIGLRFIDQSGGRATVFAIDRVVEINDRFWQPDLKGYQQSPAISAKMAPASSENE